MTKYGYILNEENGKVEKSILETYPDLDVLQRGLERGRQTATIKKAVLKAYQGEAEKFLVSQEEAWFTQQVKIQDLEDELLVLTSPKLDEYGNEAERTEEEQAEVDTRILAINGTDDTLGELIKAEEARVELETKFEWLQAYRGLETEVVRPVPEAVIPAEITKKLIAYERDNKVRNLEDSVADLSKMNALLMSFASAMYGTLTDTAKGKIPTEMKGLIEYAVTKWPETQTRGDRQLASEGVELIDKLFEREVAIADIIDTMKS